MAASTLHSTSPPTAVAFVPSTNPNRAKHTSIISCGPRDKRGPLVKGRVLSIEAIQAVQALKRLDKSTTDDDTSVSITLSRLIKNDLVASMDELLRQDRCDLALKVFRILKSEYAIGLDKYAGIVKGLGRMKKWDAIDELVRDLEMENGGLIDCEDDKSVVKMLKALIEYGRGESLVKMYEMMMRSGWGVAIHPDEYTVKVLVRGLRSVGQVELAGDVEIKFGLQKVTVSD